ncbi:hypothetical protein PM082_009842 [Marasmius tenuissimus]|nr:hypothetical protein PM082_009842 [Marasmius tenuissimus]
MNRVLPHPTARTTPSIHKNPWCISRIKLLDTITKGAGFRSRRRVLTAMFNGAAHPRYTLTTVFRLVVVNPLLIHSVNLFLYTLYIFLFRRVLSILSSRKTSPDLRFHRITLVLLFILASVSVPICMVDDIITVADILWTYEGVELPVRLRDISDNLDICRFCILLVMGFAGDSIMIFRCYILWGHRRWYAIVPFVGLVLIDLVGITTGILYVKHGSHMLEVVANVCVVANGVLNFILASMIAGRLLWISRMRRDWLEEVTARHLLKIVSILLGSGFLLPVVMVIDVIGNLLPDRYWFDAGCVMTQILGIAPTLIVVRANACQNGSEAVVDTYGPDGNTTGDLESRPESADLQARAGS